MDIRTPHALFDPGMEILSPETQRLPMVFSSPHSGAQYPLAFQQQSVLDARTLRRSEDSHVDALFGLAPALGAPLIRALFPRAYLDVNREPFELDPDMFQGPLPAYVNSHSPRVSAGLGTIARIVSSGAEIYRGKLTFEEAEQRIEMLYRPYHAALWQLVEQTRQRFGYCILIDCHSMPSLGGPTDPCGGGKVDFVLGDCFGSACAPCLPRTTDAALRHMGFRVLRNTPYAGGFTTRHYGRPQEGLHAMQIEINRGIYMNEATHEPLPEFDRLRDALGHLVATLAALPASELTP